MKDLRTDINALGEALAAAAKAGFEMGRRRKSRLNRTEVKQAIAKSIGPYSYNEGLLRGLVRAANTGHWQSRMLTGQEFESIRRNR